MSLLPRLIYLTALAVLVAAGVLLTSRGALAPTAATVPDGCASVSRSAVEAVAAVAVATEEATVADDGGRIGRWLAEDGSVIVEVRCARVTLTEAREQADAVARAEAGSGSLLVLDTDPTATLDLTTMGSVIVQVDEDERLRRTWFVAAPLTSTEAEALVTATARRDVAPTAAPPR